MRTRTRQLVVVATTTSLVSPAKGLLALLLVVALLGSWAAAGASASRPVKPQDVS